MSGGSYDYLCFHEFLDREDLLLRMADRLLNLGYLQAADETYRVLHELRGMDEYSRLRDAWRAVEWKDSGDTGLDQLREEMSRLGWRRTEKAVEA